MATLANPPLPSLITRLEIRRVPPGPRPLRLFTVLNRARESLGPDLRALLGQDGAAVGFGFGGETDVGELWLQLPLAATPLHDPFFELRCGGSHGDVPELGFGEALEPRWTGSSP